MSLELQVAGLVGTLPHGGRVHRASDPSVLIKRVDGAASARLADEAAWRATALHPMLGRDPALVELDGAPALRWRGVAGVPLDAAIAALGPLPARVSLGIVAQVGALLGALDEAEGAALPLHRGLIGPADLALSPDGQLTLLDPGSGPRAPDSGDGRTQTWRLGALLFSLCCGSTPPRPGRLASAYDRTLRRALDPGLDPALAELLRDLLCAEPSHRPWPEEALGRVQALERSATGPALASWAMERLFEVPPPEEQPAEAALEPAAAEPAAAEPAALEPAAAEPAALEPAAIAPAPAAAAPRVSGLEPDSEELLFQPPEDLVTGASPAETSPEEAPTLRDEALPSMEELLFEPPPELLADAPTAVAEDDDETELDTQSLREDPRTAEITEALSGDPATAELVDPAGAPQGKDTPPPPLFSADLEQAEVSRTEDATDPDGLILARKLAFDEDTEPVETVNDAGLVSEEPPPSPAPPPPRRSGPSPAIWVGLAVLLVIVVVVLAAAAQAG